MGDDFAEVWDPGTNLWAPLPAPDIRASLSPRTECRARAVAGGALVCWDVRSETSEDCGRVELFDEESGRWFCLPTRHATPSQNIGQLVSF